MHPFLKEMFNKWFDDASVLKTKLPNENDVDLVEAFEVLFSFGSLLGALLNASDTKVVTITKNEKGEVINMEVSDGYQAPAENP